MTFDQLVQAIQKVSSEWDLKDVATLEQLKQATADLLARLKKLEAK